MNDNPQGETDIPLFSMLCSKDSVANLGGILTN